MKKDGLYTASVTLGGSMATGGPMPGGRTEVKGATVGDGLAYVIMGLAQLLSFGPGTIPGEKMRATVQALGGFVADLVLAKNAERSSFIEDFVRLVLRYQKHPLGLRADDIDDLAHLAVESSANRPIGVPTGVVEYELRFREGITGSYEQRGDKKLTLDLGPLRPRKGVEVWLAGEGFLVPRGVTEYLAKIDVGSIIDKNETDLGDGMYLTRAKMDSLRAKP